jgi:hypothetical protein
MWKSRIFTMNENCRYIKPNITVGKTRYTLKTMGT